MLNKLTIIGHLGKEPEMKSFPDGGVIASFSVATTEKWKTKTGEPKEHTEWHRVQFSGKLADVVGKYLHKGSLVYVEGKLHTREYTDKEGAKQRLTEVRGEVLKMIGKSEQKAEGKPAPKPTGGSGFDDLDDAIPF